MMIIIVYLSILSTTKYHNPNEPRSTSTNTALRMLVIVRNNGEGIDFRFHVSLNNNGLSYHTVLSLLHIKTSAT